MADAAAPPLSARIVHTLDGRTRLRLLGTPPHDRLIALADALAAAGIEKVDIRPRTGSIVLTHSGPLSGLSDALEEAGLHLLPRIAEPQKDAVAEAGERVAQADLVLRLTSGGTLDLRNAAFLGLMAAGLVQLARGRIAGPALTLFGQAATLALMEARRRG
ncbi:hypothetical protein [Aquabacter spiritensis]|uniref:Uncharacterized protein n=1 Tax=Aquabacter spiritensis TaxID=933073 RepID=A0A4R3M3I3_9HYPH|nr:hypothetical protein [Aquabacter spiritensis]TCT07801.1 hypothetical protein EDC64_101320 [Aquabacter spiritensis]